MMEDTEPAQPGDENVGGTNVALGDEDVLIDVEGFYFDYLEYSH